MYKSYREYTEALNNAARLFNPSVNKNWNLLIKKTDERIEVMENVIEKVKGSLSSRCGREISYGVAEDILHMISEDARRRHSDNMLKRAWNDGNPDQKYMLQALAKDPTERLKGIAKLMNKKIEETLGLENLLTESVIKKMRRIGH